MKTRWSRREFLKTTTAAVVFAAAEKSWSATTNSLPKRRLGKTGEMVSCIGFGCGSRFCSIESEDAAQALLERAFNLGVNYFDTASSYTRRGIERLSEKRIGEFSKSRRKEIFLATKFDPERSRRRLAIDRAKSKTFANRLPRPDPDPQPKQSRRPRKNVRQPTVWSPPSSNSRIKKSPASSASPATTTAPPWPKLCGAMTSTR